LKTASFGHILKESTHSCFDAWLFLLVHIRFTPSEGPKGFTNWFFEEIGPWMLDHRVRPWKEGHFPWSDYMVHEINRPLALGGGREHNVTIHLKFLNLQMKVPTK
jgi:hypothetical protein